MNDKDREAVRELIQHYADTQAIYQGMELFAIPINAEVWEEETAVEREYLNRGPRVQRHWKGGTITLLWDEWVDTADHSQGVRTVERTITVSKKRAEQAFRNLAANQLEV